ncbi:MAG: MFS transporter [Pyrinomonadaceae bacterium MAG19_C2-C3]|nr:MFS transporter [Pyrinomonadaceae bacterium MAG19_C2-C3]
MKSIHAEAKEKSGVVRRALSLPRNVLVISLVSFLNDASSEIIYPLLPLFLALTLGASPVAVGVIEGTAESVSSLLKLFSGYWSDRRGRRKIFVVLGYALASTARPILGFAVGWKQVLSLRVLDRVGKGIRSAPRDAMIADAAAPEERGLAFGFHRALDHAGAVVGPLLGLLFLQLVAANPNQPTASDYRTVFLLASIPAFAAVLVALIAIKERKPKIEAANFNHDIPDDTEAKPAPVRFTLRGFDRNFIRFLFIISLFTLSNSSDAFLLLRAQEAGIAVTTIPLLWAALHVCKVASSIIGGDLSDRFGRKRLIALGWLVYTIVYAGFAFATEAWQMWTLFLVYGIYFGLTEGTEKALIADLVPPDKRGTAYGLYNLAFSFTVLPASLLLGALWKWYGAPTAFLTSAIISIAATVLLVTLVQPKRREVVPLA